MPIPHLSKRISSTQDWRKPTKIKASRAMSGHQKTTGSFSISSKYSNKKNGRSPAKKFWGCFLPTIIVLILIGDISTLATLAWISKDLPSPDGVINRSVTVSTKIYDQEGKTVLYDIHGDIKRTLIDLSEIPDHVVKATLAAEDREFYQHKGFSLIGIARSVLTNLLTGSRVGGSTLTQQFVKNAVLTNEKTYTRKIKELLISYQLEKKFEKNELLQMYFNEIPYGSVIYGVEAAAQSFFGKSAKDISVAEGAILAAIPKAPTFYSPYGNNRDRLIARQRYIIDSMEELTFITPQEAEIARQEKIIFKPLKESIIAPHFVMYVRELLSEKYGEAFITQEGLKVTTSLNLEKQKMAEQAVTDGVEKNKKQYDLSNASLVAIDPATGQIVAMVGSVDYFNDEIDGQVNVALRIRQPGSSFKPIVYTAAFVKGYTPETILYDVVTNFEDNEDKKYEPKNYDLEERGPVTIRKALAGSLNIPAVKATYLTGTDNIIDLAENLGYTTFTDRSRYGLSIVLGGGEVKLIEHTNAFATLAQEGIRHDISPILKIEDKNGRVLFEYKDKKKKILEPKTTRLITNILSDDSARAYVFGEGSTLTLPDRPVAAKTGTTNDYRDAWTIGYTPDLAVGVWVGNNDNSAMKRGAAGGVVAAPIWNQFMKEALRDSTPTAFNEPEEIETNKPVLKGQETGEIKIKIDTISGKLATEYTPESTTKELNIKDIHNILYYVEKDDPQGDAPKDPSRDPQFDNWEEPVLKWAKDQGFDTGSGQKIPTEYDDVHFAADQPSLIIITPLPNQTIQSSRFNIELTASAKRGVKKIEYYIDNQLVITKNDTGDTILDASDFSNGYHTITIKVKDDLENTATKSMELNLMFPQIIPILNWTEPRQNSTVDIPITLKATLANWEKAEKIDFYFKSSDSSLEHYINHISPQGADISLVWNKTTEPGNYTIFGNIFSKTAKKYQTEELHLTVE